SDETTTELRCDRNAMHARSVRYRSYRFESVRVQNLHLRGVRYINAPRRCVDKDVVPASTSRQRYLLDDVVADFRLWGDFWSDQTRQRHQRCERSIHSSPPVGTVLLLVTAVAAGILESLALFGNEFPVVSLEFQRQLQNAEGCRVANLTCCFRLPKGAMILAPGANHEFTNSVLSV